MQISAQRTRTGVPWLTGPRPAAMRLCVGASRCAVGYRKRRKLHNYQIGSKPITLEKLKDTISPHTRSSLQAHVIIPLYHYRTCALGAHSSVRTGIENDFPKWVFKTVSAIALGCLGCCGIYAAVLYWLLQICFQKGWGKIARSPSSKARVFGIARNKCRVPYLSIPSLS